MDRYPTLFATISMDLKKLGFKFVGPTTVYLLPFRR